MSRELGAVFRREFFCCAPLSPTLPGPTPGRPGPNPRRLAPAATFSLPPERHRLEKGPGDLPTRARSTRRRRWWDPVLTERLSPGYWHLLGPRPGGGTCASSLRVGRAWSFSRLRPACFAGRCRCGNRFISVSSRATTLLSLSRVLRPGSGAGVPSLGGETRSSQEQKLGDQGLSAPVVTHPHTDWIWVSTLSGRPLWWLKRMVVMLNDVFPIGGWLSLSMFHPC
jgi:hypothetical protein